MTTLTAGQTAPEFTGIDQEGKKINLKDFKGKKVILYFYPADLTPTCTVEACNLRDNHDVLQANGYTVIGVSPDGPEKHRKFIDRHQLPFTLIADENHAIAKKYGVWGRKKMFGNEYDGILRTTFVIDENGKLTEVITKVKSKVHTAQILK